MICEAHPTAAPGWYRILMRLLQRKQRVSLLWVMVPPPRLLRGGFGGARGEGAGSTAVAGADVTGPGC